VNWSELLAYKTVKVVTIRQWQLGILHYGIQIGLLCYVVGLVLLFDLIM
jgi:hypothetical protein